MGTVAIANNIPGDMLCEKTDSSVVCLQHVPEGKECVHMQNMCRPTLHDTKLLHMLLPSINYNYVIDLNCLMLL
jgi:hypothetical protein